MYCLVPDPRVVIRGANHRTHRDSSLRRNNTRLWSVILYTRNHNLHFKLILKLYTLKKGKHRTAFGSVVKYIEVKPDETTIQSPEDWDNAIQVASDHFSKLMVIIYNYYIFTFLLLFIFIYLKHNIVTNNCHDHVCEVLNAIKYKGKNNWNNVTLVWELCLHSKYVSTSRFINNWLPFIIIIFIVLGL